MDALRAAGWRSGNKPDRNRRWGLKGVGFMASWHMMVCMVAAVFVSKWYSV